MNATIKSNAQGECEVRVDGTLVYSSTERERCEMFARMMGYNVVDEIPRVDGSEVTH